MRNGYALATESGLSQISGYLRNASEIERDKLRGLLRIGVQWNTQVTLGDSQHNVSQDYCSALPVAYSRHPWTQWTAFAKFVLEASYEATFCAAILNYKETGNSTLFLTLLGGGAFGNETDWIISGIQREVDLYQDQPLDVAIVSFGSSKQAVRRLASDA